MPSSSAIDIGLDGSGKDAGAGAGADDDGVACAGGLPARAQAAAKEKESARVTLFRAMKTVRVMLLRRGYRIHMVGPHETPTDADAQARLEEFKDAARAIAAEQDHELVMEAVVAEDAPKHTTAWAQSLQPGSPVLVIIVSGGSVKTIREVEDTMQEMDIKHVILLSRLPLTPFSRKYLKKLDPHECRIESFLLSELQRPICNHQLTPEHVVLSAREVQTLRERFVEARFPELPASDPMVRFLGLQKDMMVAVRECVGRAQAAITYFIVTEEA